LGIAVSLVELRWNLTSLLLLLLVQTSEGNLIGHRVSSDLYALTRLTPDEQCCPFIFKGCSLERDAEGPLSGGSLGSGVRRREDCVQITGGRIAGSRPKGVDPVGVAIISSNASQIHSAHGEDRCPRPLGSPTQLRPRTSRPKSTRIPSSKGYGTRCQWLIGADTCTRQGFASRFSRRLLAWPAQANLRLLQ